MRELLEHLKESNFTSIPYEDLSQWSVGEAVIKEAVNHWEPLGFLAGITNNTHKEILAVAYDNLAHDFLSENERLLKLRDKYNFNCSPDEGDDYKTDSYFAAFDFEVVIFPIARRVICGVPSTDDDGVGALFTYAKFLDYLEDLSFFAINYDGYDKEFDIEAEFAAMMSLLIEKRFNNEK